MNERVKKVDQLFLLLKFLGISVADLIMQTTHAVEDEILAWDEVEEEVLAAKGENAEETFLMIQDQIEVRREKKDFLEELSEVFRCKIIEKILSNELRYSTVEDVEKMLLNFVSSLGIYIETYRVDEWTRILRIHDYLPNQESIDWEMHHSERLCEVREKMGEYYEPDFDGSLEDRPRLD